MKKIILMGATGCGKTTLVQALHGQSLDYDKTQTLQFLGDIVDTPGEYLLHRSYIQSLTVTAVEADVIGLVQSVYEKEQVFSPGFAGLFSKDVIGIVTKIDLTQAAENVSFIENQLREAGVKRIFKLSAYQPKSLKALKEYLKWSKKDESLYKNWG
jgi:ethanolamine utilization protein EutP